MCEYFEKISFISNLQRIFSGDFLFLLRSAPDCLQCFLLFMAFRQQNVDLISHNIHYRHLSIMFRDYQPDTLIIFDLEADGAQTFEEKYVSCFVFESCTSCGGARCTRCRYGREVVKGESAGNHSSKWPTIESAIKEPFVAQRYFRPIKLLFRLIFLSQYRNPAPTVESHEWCVVLSSFLLEKEFKRRAILLVATKSFIVQFHSFALTPWPSETFLPFYLIR